MEKNGENQWDREDRKHRSAYKCGREQRNIIVDTTVRRQKNWIRYVMRENNNCVFEGSNGGREECLVKEPPIANNESSEVCGMLSR